MIDDARSVWELIERRVDGHARPRDALRRRPRHDVRASTATLAERAAAGLHALGVGADVNVSWQLPTWTESAVLVGALCRLGAVQNPMLPIYRYREVSFIAKQTQLQAADHAVDVEQLRLRRRSPSRSRARTTTCTRSSPTTGTPTAIPRRCRPPPAVFDDPADDPVRWIFYTSGTTAAPKGAQHTDRSVLAGAIGYAKKTHVVDDDIALVAFPFTHVGGIIIGVFTPLLTGSAAVLMEAWTAAGVDRAHPQARRDARQRRGRDPRRADRRGEGRSRRVQDGPRLPERRIGASRRSCTTS